MHVLMYADRPASYGGIETHMATLAKELLLLGHRATLAFSRIDCQDLFSEVRAHGGDVVAADRHEVENLALERAVDVVHAHSHRASKVALALRQRSRVPAVTTLHSPEQALPTADGRLMTYIAVSREISASLSRQAIPHAVIENGVDLERFAPPGLRSRRRRRWRVVYLGRVSPAKTPGVLAVDEALGRRQDVELRYVCNWAPMGNGRPLAGVEAELREADLVFSTGRGVREAMACGAAAAVLGSYWDGVVTRENVDRLEWYNFSGRATRRPPTAEQVAFALRELMADPRRLAELKALGPELAARRWDAKEMAKRTAAVYESAARNV